MGRKSTKAKDKRNKRKEENAKFKAQKELTDAANALEDPMAALLPFKKFERNGLSLNICCQKAPTIDKAALDWAYELTKANMQTLYESSDWGWSDSQKKEEMTEDAAWYLLAYDANNTPLACVHFRFDVDEEEEVVYCYEIQLEKSVRRKGLGKFLMQILEMVAFKTQMKKVMLTVFKHNTTGQEFFKKTLKYEVDETSPEDTMEDKIFCDDEGYSYEILSKQIAKRTSKPLTTASQQNGLTES